MVNFQEFQNLKWWRHSEISKWWRHLEISERSEIQNDATHEITKSKNGPESAFSIYYMPMKTLWEKEKLLVTSNFSVSHSVFYPLG